MRGVAAVTTQYPNPLPVERHLVCRSILECGGLPPLFLSEASFARDKAQASLRTPRLHDAMIGYVLVTGGEVLRAFVPG